ncbi:hypothetical protein LINGRAHAP2_LOCUS4916 [Linum grandiflorum]
MLGKQGWKLLTDSNALVSRIYKAKYFPMEDFFSAAKGSNPSYIWQRIRSTQRLLERGYRWRLGNGVLAGQWGVGQCLKRPVDSARGRLSGGNTLE